LAARFPALARAVGGFAEQELSRLEDLRAILEEHRSPGMTEKNLRLIRQVLSPGVWEKVVNLPEQLMKRARSQQDHAPVKAAVNAQLAVSVAILTLAPVRLANLTAIR